MPLQSAVGLVARRKSQPLSSASRRLTVPDTRCCEETLRQLEVCRRVRRSPLMLRPASVAGRSLCGTCSLGSDSGGYLPPNQAPLPRASTRPRPYRRDHGNPSSVCLALTTRAVQCRPQPLPRRRDADSPSADALRRRLCRHVLSQCRLATEHQNQANGHGFVGPPTYHGDNNKDSSTEKEKQAEFKRRKEAGHSFKCYLGNIIEVPFPRRR